MKSIIPFEEVGEREGGGRYSDRQIIEAIKRKKAVGREE